ncbi:hypothetical protein MLD38_021201 [Melastoma candidum]|uniref:Uncharacterized protein n=1 Tax=Melastoma candidum TaxID=119954 RepID=A0ACB9QEL0_9MYRT|nr:hypothetical protein MLD38_021201 [Melastoma candidum]
MMGSKGGGGGGNNGVPAVIPTGARKIVQSLKEIVNCSEQEIYAALKECSMDPNEAVNRLLSQDPFHEVKSKREKKKEVKDTTDPRPRGVVASSRGGRTGVDRHPVRAIISDSSKPILKRENGSHALPSSLSSSSAVSAPNINRQLAYSDHLPLENKVPAIGENDLITSSVQSLSGFQRSWGGTSGQVSMADIVKMGKPQSVSDHFPSNDYDWPLEEQQAPPLNDDGWSSFDNSQDDSGQHTTSRLDVGHPSEDGCIESNTKHMGFASISSRNIQEDDGQDPSLYDSSVYKNVDAFQPHMHGYEREGDEHELAEDNGVAAVSTNLQHLSLQKNQQGSAPEDTGPAVVIPDHLQVHPADCQHLSFGSFGPSIGTFSGSTESRSFKSSLADAPPIPDAPSASNPEIRDSERYGDEHHRPNSNGDDAHSGVPGGGNYEPPSASPPEVLKQHQGESVAGNQYASPSAASGYNYENTQALDSTFTHMQASSPMQNLRPLSDVLPSYTDPLPSALLASTVQSGRDSDLSYLPFPVTQPLAAKYSNTATALNSLIMSTQEVNGLRAGSISAAQQAPQNLPTAGLANGPVVPQHLAMHAYSQPALSLGPFPSVANMVSYSFLPQSYSYMTSAFQQALASSNDYHQSLAVVPQYKNSVPTSNLPQSGVVASGYGFNSSTNVPGGNFTLNPLNASTTLGYRDTLNSQYKDAANLLSLQQNDNSGMWVPGGATRTVQNVPATTYYDFQGQSQLPGGLRQAQQPSQHFSSLGYPNFFQSSGISLEQQQQLMREAALGGGSQGQQQPKQSGQLWQNTY